MKKFSITLASDEQAFEVNANEYSVSPKTGLFEATVCGKVSQAWTTSGKGKSAINNHYIYFKDGDQLFYFKCTAVQVLEARKGLVVSLPGAADMSVGGEQDLKTTKEAIEAAAELIMAEVVEAPSAPAPKRTRSRR